MVFASTERVIETGIHARYREIWHRLPGSTGRSIALAEPERPDGSISARLFIAGKYMMRVRRSNQAGPEFEISFGDIESGKWHIARSTLPELEGRELLFSATRCGNTKATVVENSGSAQWNVLEWNQE